MERKLLANGVQSMVFESKLHPASDVIKTPTIFWFNLCRIPGHKFLNDRVYKSLSLVQKYYPKYLVNTRILTPQSVPIIWQEKIPKIIPLTARAIELKKISRELEPFAACSLKMQAETGCILDFGLGSPFIGKRLDEDQNHWELPNLILFGKKIKILDFYVFDLNKETATLIDLLFKKVQLKNILAMQQRLNLKMIDEKFI